MTTPTLATGTDLDAVTGTWTIDPSHTTIAFAVRHAMVAKVRGRFADFEGALHLDGTDPTRSSADLTIVTASIDTKSPDRDAHLTSADFFDAETFPALTFRSTSVQVKGGNDFVLVGELTVRDVTREVQIDVELVGVHADPWGGTRIGLEGRTEISRKDFGLTWNVAIEGGGVVVGDRVKIELDVEAVLAA